MDKCTQTRELWPSEHSRACSDHFVRGKSACI